MFEYAIYQLQLIDQQVGSESHNHRITHIKMRICYLRVIIFLLQWNIIMKTIAIHKTRIVCLVYCSFDYGCRKKKEQTNIEHTIGKHSFKLYLYTVLISILYRNQLIYLCALSFVRYPSMTVGKMTRNTVYFNRD